VRSEAVRALDFLTGESLPIRSLLRLALIALIALLVSVSHVSHWLDTAFVAVLTVYGIATIGWLVFLLNSPYRRWYSWAATTVDVLFVVTLCVVSGGATVWLLPIFFLLPIPVVFLDNPMVTAALGLAAAAGYLVAWAVHAGRDERLAIPGVVYVQLGAMLWLTVALTTLAYSLRRRAERVESLLEVRRRLVSEVLQADARNSRALSEQLHDGPLQNLLAARFDVHELRTRPSGAAIDRIEAALGEASAALRATVSTLHPQVLEQAGLAAALRQLIAGHEQRWDIAIDADIDDVGRPAGRALLYRAARELLVNAVKHARAERLWVRLSKDDDTVTLVVADDGIGFDPDVLADRVAQGHIGLASLMAGIEAMGGSVRLETGEGGGTAVTVTVTDAPPRR
jgi:two-component system NarL family sensor kinase